MENYAIGHDDGKSHEKSSNEGCIPCLNMPDKECPLNKFIIIINFHPGCMPPPPNPSLDKTIFSVYFHGSLRTMQWKVHELA